MKNGNKKSVEQLNGVQHRIFYWLIKLIFLIIAKKITNVKLERGKYE